MENLKATLDWSKQTVTFSGPGTFRAKDAIKKLPAARWVGEKKVWVASLTSVSIGDLEKIFPDVIIEEVGEPSKECENSDECDGEAPAAASSSPLLSQAITVSELIAKIRDVILLAFPNRILVKGVIAKVTQPKHLYLELVDLENPSDHVSCFVWQEDIERVCKPLFERGFKLEPELDVMFEAIVGLNPRKGAISLSICSVVVEYTIGKIAAERDKTNERLKKEGLFGLNKKCKLSILPTKLGIITSSGGTVINDFLAALETARFGFELFWYKANVQGAGAKEQIINGLRVLGTLPGIDAILIFRGGGSPAELAIFNDYELAKQVCLCEVPVVSAIGHQEDQSSVQDVSYRGEGVPKDVGSFFASIVEDLRCRCRESISQMVKTVVHVAEFAEASLGGAVSQIMRMCKRLIMSRTEVLELYRASLPILARGLQINISRRLIDITRPMPALSSSIFVRERRSLKKVLGDIQLSSNMLMTYRFKQMAMTNRGLVRGYMFIFETGKLRLVKALDLPRLALQCLRFGELSLEKHEKSLRDMSPDVQLKRGFVLVRERGNGKYVLSGSELLKEQEIELQFHDTDRSAIIK